MHLTILLFLQRQNTMPFLKIFSLGPPRLELDEQTITLPRKKALALLIYLTLAPEPVSRERLATLLWNEHATTPRNNLRRTLFTLRKYLGEKWIEAEGQFLRLTTESRWADIITFDMLAHPASRLLPTQLRNEALPIAQWKQAVELYRGQFMEGFYIRASDFEEWQMSQQRQWEQRLVVVLHNLTQALLLTQDYAQAMPYALRWVELDPTDESAHRALMSVYWHTDQRIQALKQYDAYQKVMRNYGLPPSPTLTAYYEQLRHEGAIVDEATRQVGLPSLTSGKAHALTWPSYVNTFLGRQDDSINILQYLQTPHCRLLTILGVGGSGKTRLAVHLARQNLKIFPGGTFFVDLSKITPQADILEAIYEAIASQRNITGSVLEDANIEQAFRRVISTRPTLVILDNFEHLTTQAEKLSYLLHWFPDLRLLVTSRHRLNLIEEWIYPLQGLPYPEDSVSLTKAGDFPAVQLFVQRARQNAPNFSLDEHNWPHVLRICQYTEGMPLALEMAATWVQQFPCQIIANELEQRLDILQIEARNIPERHRSWRISCDYSWSLLSDEMRNVLCALAIFKNDFDYRAAEAISSVNLATLNALVNRSWLFTAPDGRYRLHPLTRQYLLVKLKENPQRHALEARHAYYYADMMSRIASRFIGQEQNVALKEAKRAIENVQAAWFWAAQNENFELLDMLCNPLFMYYKMNNLFRTGRQHFEYVMLQIELSGLPSRVACYNRLRNRFAWFEYILGDHIVPADTWLKGVRTAEAWDDKNEIAFCEYNLGMLLRIRGDLHQAVAHLSRGLALYRELKDAHGIANAQKQLGYVYRNLDDGAKAEEHFRNALHGFEQLSDTYNIAQTYANLSPYIALDGDEAKARLMLQQALDMATSMENQHLRAFILGQVAELQPPGEAVKTYHQMVLVFESLGDRVHAGITYNNLADAFIKMQNYPQAEDNYYLALHIFQECEDQRGKFFTTYNLGNLHIIWGHFEIARSHLQDALRQALQLASVPLGLYVFSGFALLFAKQGLWNEARGLANFILNHPLLSHTTTPEDTIKNAQWVLEQIKAPVSWQPSWLPDAYPRLTEALLTKIPLKSLGV